MSGHTLAPVIHLQPLRPELVWPDLWSEDALATDEGPAPQDASSIAARIADDEAQADVAGQRYQAEGLPSLEADARFAALRQPEEQLHAIYGGALLEITPGDGTTALLLLGTLYLTSRRLLHAGGQLFELVLGGIDRTVVALDRLILIRLHDGSDLALDVDRPRLLRVQIAAAQAAEMATDKV